MAFAAIFASAAETGACWSKPSCGRRLRHCQSIGRETLADQRAAVTAFGSGLCKRRWTDAANARSAADGIAAQWRMASGFAHWLRQRTCHRQRQFDLDVPAGHHANGPQLAQLLSHGRPFWVAGSTREGEEAFLLRALAGIPAPAVSRRGLPRHPERWDGVATFANELFRVARRSAAEADADAEVVIGDWHGEMLAYYAASTAAIMAERWRHRRSKPD